MASSLEPRLNSGHFLDYRYVTCVNSVYPKSALTSWNEVIETVVASFWQALRPRRAPALLVFVLSVFPVIATSAERIALLLGNSNYGSPELNLVNPVNDVRALADALRRHGFTVIEAIDLDAPAMRSALSQFGEQAAGAEMALFFYAGHGMQYGGDNLLIGVDFNGANVADLQRASLSMTEIRQTITDAAPLAGLILLDACRDAPFADAGTVPPGLVRTRGGVGLLIAYATDPGNVAYDGEGGNSVFTTALLGNIDTPSLDVRLMLGRVRQEVVLDTFGRQVPWVEEALIGEHVISTAPATTGAADAVTEEVRMWRAAYAGGSANAMQSYLNTYPQGMFAEVAHERLAAPVPVNLGTRGFDLTGENPDKLIAALSITGFPVQPGDDAVAVAVGQYLAAHPELDGEDLGPLYDDAARRAMVLAAATAQRLRTDLVALRSVDRLQTVSLDALSQIEGIAASNPEAAPVLEQARADVEQIAIARERILERLDQSRSYYQEIIDNTVAFLPADASGDLIVVARGDAGLAGIDQRLRDDAELFLRHVRESDLLRKGSYSWLTDFL